MRGGYWRVRIAATCSWNSPHLVVSAIRYSIFRALRSDEVFSVSEVAVLEVGEHEGRLRDLAYLAGADGDVLEGAPPSDEQGEAVLTTQAAQRPQQRVAGPGVDVQLSAVGGLFDRGVYPDPGAFVARVLAATVSEDEGVVLTAAVRER